LIAQVPFRVMGLAGARCRIYRSSVNPTRKVTW
jgi:hypothetical protein